LFATQNRDVLLEKGCATQQQNNFLFLGFGYKVNVRFNFRSRKTQAGMQVSSAILFRVPLFNRFIIEKVLSQITNMEYIFSAKSHKPWQLPGCLPGCGSGYTLIISKLLPYNLRGIISRMFFCVCRSLDKNSFFLTSQDTVVCHCLRLSS